MRAEIWYVQCSGSKWPLRLAAAVAAAGRREPTATSAEESCTDPCLDDLGVLEGLALSSRTFALFRGLVAGLAELLPTGTFEGDRLGVALLFGDPTEEGVGVLEEEREVGILPTEEEELAVLRCGDEELVTLCWGDTDPTVFLGEELGVGVFEAEEEEVALPIELCFGEA